jgi:uncharacterized membrane protein YkvA (DUF1232 family)
MSARTGPTREVVQLGLRGWRFVRHLPQFARLYWRLFRDRRVSIWPKALLVLTAMYLLLPFDVLPDFVPLIGAVDDLILVIAACRLFMYMCPRDVVLEHVRRISEGQ